MPIHTLLALIQRRIGTHIMQLQHRLRGSDTDCQTVLLDD